MLNVLMCSHSNEVRTMPKHTLIGYSIQVNPNGYLNSGADLNELENTPEPPSQRDLSLLSDKEKGELKISSVENYVLVMITYSMQIHICERK